MSLLTGDIKAMSPILQLYPRSVDRPLGSRVTLSALLLCYPILKYTASMPIFRLNLNRSILLFLDILPSEVTKDMFKVYALL